MQNIELHLLARIVTLAPRGIMHNAGLLCATTTTEMACG